MDNSFTISGVAVIICIAIGILTFVLLFIFAKRQIVRFALKSHHGVHVPIGSDAPKWLKQEIERRLNIVKNIKLEPYLLNSLNSNHTCQHLERNHLYRMKAMDSLKILENAIVDSSSENNKRPAGQDLRVYLLKLTKDNGPLSSCDSKLINKFVDSYNNGRYEPNIFGKEQFEEYLSLLNAIKSCINSTRSSPNTKPSRHKETTAQMILNGKTQVSIVDNKENKENENVDSIETTV